MATTVTKKPIVEVEGTAVPGAAAGTDDSVKVSTSLERLAHAKDAPRPVAPAPDETSISHKPLPDDIPHLNEVMPRDLLETEAAEAFVKSTVGVERQRGPLAALAIGLVAKLMRDYHPTGKEVAAILLSRMPVENPSKRYILQPLEERVVGSDDSPALDLTDDLAAALKVPVDYGRIQIKPPRSDYRQYATRYIFLARIFSGQRDKADAPHPDSVVIMSSVYANPVGALLAGESLSSVFKAWHDIVRPAPAEDLVALADIESAQSAARAQAADGGMSATVRMFNPAKKGYVRKKVSAEQSRPVLRGMVRGLIDLAAKQRWSWSERAVGELLAAMGWRATELQPIAPADET